jgi:hypothetical protein
MLGPVVTIMVTNGAIKIILEYSRIVQRSLLLKGSIRKATRLGKQFAICTWGKRGNQGPQWDKHYGTKAGFPSPTAIPPGIVYWDYVCIHVPSIIRDKIPKPVSRELTEYVSHEVLEVVSWSHRTMIWNQYNSTGDLLELNGSNSGN